jgi:hypothetical protein
MPVLRLVGAALLLAPAAALAQQWTSQKPATLTATGVNQATLGQGSSAANAIVPRTYQNTGNGLGIVRDMVKGPHPNRVDVIDVEVRRAVNWPKAAKAISRSLPALGTAIAVAELLEEIRCREGFGSGGAECDLGTNEVPSVGYTGVFAPPRSYVLTPVQAATPVIEQSGQSWAASWGSGATSTQSGSITCTGGPHEFFCSGRTWTARSPDGAAVYGTFTPGATVRSSAFYGENALACPSITINGVPMVPAKDSDGKCPTGVYSSASVVDVEARIVEHGNPERMPQVLPELLDRGVPIEHDTPTVDAPATVFDSRTSKSNQDGSITVTDKSWSISDTPTGYQWVPVVVEKTYPPGETIPPPGQQTGSGGTVTQGGTTGEILTCGLPGTPPCKLDETGTPTAGNDGQARADLEAAANAAIAKVNEALSVQLPWVWGFSLPAGACSNWVIPAAGVLPGGTVDICGQWIVGFWRDLWAWALAVFAGWYAWRRYSDAVGAR